MLKLIIALSVGGPLISGLLLTGLVAGTADNFARNAKKTFTVPDQKALAAKAKAENFCRSAKFYYERAVGYNIGDDAYKADLKAKAQEACGLF